MMPDSGGWIATTEPPSEKNPPRTACANAEKNQTSHYCHAKNNVIFVHCKTRFLGTPSILGINPQKPINAGLFEPALLLFRKILSIHDVY
jgi:hypothetical protein